MPRYRLIIEYDGRPFCGWQRQADNPSAQQALEEALARFLGEAPRTTCAGRTDAGVHALHQVVHLDVGREWRTDKLRDAANAHLRPAPISVLKAEVVPDHFDARRSAIRRDYLYRILDRRSPPALEGGRVWHVPFALDAKLMDQAAQALTGRHDFTTFRATECQANSPERTLDQLDVLRMSEEIHIYASARSFLHSQVRSMVGSLLLVGRGTWKSEEIARRLAAKDRSQCGALAPPEGLYLTGVGYPDAALVFGASKIS
jgi:tRNA pseudouridine38-40 synthase